MKSASGVRRGKPDYQPAPPPPPPSRRPRRTIRRIPRRTRRQIHRLRTPQGLRPPAKSTQGTSYHHAADEPPSPRRIIPLPPPHVRKHREEKKERDQQRSPKGPASASTRPIPILRNTREFDLLRIRHAIGRHDRQLEETFGIFPRLKNCEATARDTTPPRNRARSLPIHIPCECGLFVP